MSAADHNSGVHLVLVEPEIPPNTGSIARLCAATQTRLHLIRPLGFSLEDRYLKRAGLDYWPYVQVDVHDDWRAFLSSQQPQTVLCFSARARTSYLRAPLVGETPLYLVFGGETGGLPSTIVEADYATTYRIPILTSQVRSLNLANAAAIVLYEALRQRGALDGA